MTTQAATTSARTLRFATHNLLRLRRNLTPLFFSTFLPVFFYLLFGTMMDFGDAAFKGGNFAALEMISMALYGGVAGSVSAAGSAVTDAKTGWARQLALTPLHPRQILWANLISIVFQALLPITAVFITGAMTQAAMQPHQWVLAIIACVLVSIPFGFYGLVWAMALPTDNSVAIASTSVVLFLFAANVFTPLTEPLMELGRFTPLFGPVVLAQWPLAEGMQFLNGEEGTVSHPMWAAWLNFAVWTTIFLTACLVLRSRDKARR